MILPDGRVLIGVVEAPFATIKNTLIYDPAAKTWSNGGTCLGIHNESTWVKLPDNSILMVACPSDGATGGASERYIPSTNTWISDATVPLDLYSYYEIGPAFLMPKGKVISSAGRGTRASSSPTR